MLNELLLISGGNQGRVMSQGAVEEELKVSGLRASARRELERAAALIE